MTQPYYNPSQPSVLRATMVSAAPGVDPRFKLGIDESRVEKGGFSATKNPDGSISIEIPTTANTVSVGYVRRNGSYSNPSSDTQIRSNNGYNRLLSIFQSGTYKLDVSYGSNGATTIKVKPDNSLDAIKVNLGGKVYYLRLADVRPAGAVASSPARVVTVPTKPDSSSQAPKEPPVSMQTPPVNSPGASSPVPASPAIAQPAVITPATSSTSSPAAVQGEQTAMSGVIGRGVELLSKNPVVIPAAVAARNAGVSKLGAIPGEGVVLPQKPSTQILLRAANDLSDKLSRTPVTVDVKFLKGIREPSVKVLADLDAAIERTAQKITGEPGRLNPRRLLALFVSGEAAEATSASGITLPKVDNPELKTLRSLVDARDSLALKLENVLSPLAESHPDDAVKGAAGKALVESRNIIGESFERRIALEADAIKKQTLLDSHKQFDANVKTSQDSFSRIKNGVANFVPDSYKGMASRASVLVEKASDWIKAKTPLLTTPVIAAEGVLGQVNQAGVIASLTPEQTQKFIEDLSKIDKNLARAESLSQAAALENPKSVFLTKKAADISEKRMQVLGKLNELLEKGIRDATTPEAKLAAQGALYIKHGDSIKGVLTGSALVDFNHNQGAFLIDTAPKVVIAQGFIDEISKTPAANRTPIDNARLALYESQKKLAEAIAVGEIAEVQRISFDKADFQRGVDNIVGEKVTKQRNLISLLDIQAADVNLDQTTRDSAFREARVLRAEVNSALADNDPAVKTEKARVENESKRSNTLREQASNKLADAEAEKNPAKKLQAEKAARKLLVEASEADLKSYQAEINQQGRRLDFLKGEQVRLTGVNADPAAISQIAEQIKLEEGVEKELVKKSGILDGRSKVSELQLKVTEKKIVVESKVGNERAKLQPELIKLEQELAKAENSLRTKVMTHNRNAVFRAQVHLSNFAQNHPHVTYGGLAVLTSVLDRAILDDSNGDVPHSFMPRIIGGLASGVIGYDLEKATSVSDDSWLKHPSHAVSATGDYLTVVAALNAHRPVLWATGRVGINAVASRAGSALLPSVSSGVSRVGSFLVGRALLGVGSGVHGYHNMSDAEKFMKDSDAQYAWRTGSPLAAGALFGAPLGPIGAGIGFSAALIGESYAAHKALRDLEKKFRGQDEQRAAIENLNRGIKGIRDAVPVTRELTKVENDVVLHVAKERAVELLMQSQDKTILTAGLGLQKNDSYERVFRAVDDQVEKLKTRSSRSGAVVSQANKEFAELFRSVETECKNALLSARAVSYGDNGKQDALVDRWESVFAAVERGSDILDTVNYVMPELVPQGNSLSPLVDPEANSIVQAAFRYAMLKFCSSEPGKLGRINEEKRDQLIRAFEEESIFKPFLEFTRGEGS